MDKQTAKQYLEEQAELDEVFNEQLSLTSSQENQLKILASDWASEYVEQSTTSVSVRMDQLDNWLKNDVGVLKEELERAIGQSIPTEFSDLADVNEPGTALNQIYQKFKEKVVHQLEGMGVEIRRV